MEDSNYDLVIIGGGVNGCGIARDAVGRGLSVYLAERDDLASGTSSASTKLIHGGLRYLEHYEFSLVRESLQEREVLWGMAPHIIWPLRFVLPYQKGLRPAWLIRLGLFLYDHLGGRKRLPGCRSVDFAKDISGTALDNRYVKGFEYSDCWVDDARLVVLNAQDTERRGGVVRTRTEVVDARRVGEVWDVTVLNHRTGQRDVIKAKAVVNASGPWINEVIGKRLSISTRSHVRLVKGSHIVVPKLFEHDKAYIFQNADKRIIFAIPYEQDYTLVGTTDVDYESAPEDVAADEKEITYLCEMVSNYFTRSVAPDDVVRSYSGIRPLFNDGTSSAQETTRDYVLELDEDAGKAPLLSIFGGKITTYRRLAEDAMEKLAPYFKEMDKPWTSSIPLPGGEMGIDGFDAFRTKLVADYPDLSSALLMRYARVYGSSAKHILEGVNSMSDLGRHFGNDLYQREVEYLQRAEWAIRAEDIVWRRTKVGLGMSADEISTLSAWLDNA